MPQAKNTPASGHERSEAEIKAIQAWQERRNEIAPLPRFRWSKEAGLTYEHPDMGVAQLLIMSAMGVSSIHEFVALVDQMAQVTQKDGQPDTDAMDSMLAMVVGMKPTNTVEAMLAIQMAAIHNATMVQVRRVRGSDHIGQLEVNGNALNKLARTFTAQAEAMKKLRPGGPQRVVVEHRHYHLHQTPEGAQAASRGGVETELERQSHVRSLSEREAVLG